ncbi:hypothetical protein H5T51_08840, partial [Candidatus Bathyarchaeota archaeon]|nr:hypothetical protein [Candidatus Bathyarchaeota archaeon]
MELSPLSNVVKRACEVLRKGASTQVLDYEKRFQSLKNFQDALLSNLIRMGLDHKSVYETARSFFGSDHARFAGIDGTMYSRPLFDMIIFFGGAYSSTGTVIFRENDIPLIRYDERSAKSGAGISSVVPIYVNEVPEVDQAFFDVSAEEEIALNKPLTEESIINNATVANWMMTFAEHFLAYRLAVDREANIRIIIMDRSLSIERASLIYDTSKSALWEKKCNLIGYEVDGETIDINDLAIARQCVCNEALGLPPPRGDYLRYAIIALLRKKAALTENQILNELGIKDEKRAHRVKKHLKKLLDKGVLTEKFNVYSLHPKYSRTWKRIKKAVNEIGER